MKKVIFCFLLAFMILISPVFSLDLKFIGGFGNLSFDSDQKSPLSIDEERFTPNFFPLAIVELSDGFNIVSYNVGFDRSPILRNRLYANIRADWQYFHIHGGPFVGLFNSMGLPVSPGLSAGLGFTVPGIIFVEAAGSSTIGILMDKTDNYFQRSGDISAGFWVPYVICSLNLYLRNFAYRDNSDLLIEDLATRYFFRADVYTKNMPFTICVDLGFEKLSRSYTYSDTDTDELKSVYMGLEGNFSLHPAVKMLLGAHIPVYSWAVRPMGDPPKKSFLFQAWAGVIWTLPAGKKSDLSI